MSLVGVLTTIATVGEVIVEGAKLGSQLAEAGLDPAKGIRRIRESKSLFADAKAKGRARLDERFPDDPYEP